MVLPVPEAWTRLPATLADPGTAALLAPSVRPSHCSIRLQLGAPPVNSAEMEVGANGGEGEFDLLGGEWDEDGYADDEVDWRHELFSLMSFESQVCTGAGGRVGATACQPLRCWACCRCQRWTRG